MEQATALLPELDAHCWPATYRKRHAAAQLQHATLRCSQLSSQAVLALRHGPALLGEGALQAHGCGVVLGGLCCECNDHVSLRVA